MLSKRSCWYQNKWLLTLLIRCTVHAADGSIKCLTNSKVISYFLPNLPSVLRHFQLRGKSNHLLNEALELMEMELIHLMSFCPTRISDIVTACSQVVKQLAALCDILVTTDIKKELRDAFLSPNGMIIIHILPDLKSLFVKNDLRKLDHNDNLILTGTKVFWTGNLFKFSNSFDG